MHNWEQAATYFGSNPRPKQAKSTAQGKEPRSRVWFRWQGAGVSNLHQLLSSIKTPIRNTTKAIPNNTISIKVKTLTVYLPTLDLRARIAGLTGMVAARVPKPL
jgi:hypothetical protein